MLICCVEPNLNFKFKENAGTNDVDIESGLAEDFGDRKETDTDGELPPGVLLATVDGRSDVDSQRSLNVNEGKARRNSFSMAPPLSLHVDPSLHVPVIALVSVGKVQKARRLNYFLRYTCSLWIDDCERESCRVEARSSWRWTMYQAEVIIVNIGRVGRVSGSDESLGRTSLWVG
ncbi:hypothetical protein F2P81_007345 [Scophthalmus maximus]|uniref:Uncharacterized protein n=1 Tax=Scophthalmus maximus TaxID=52904 RepID=A0A6A4T5C7_SCOMX|nr:hypothetical protein F2P81_007345 [Scophthalmus maximus]